MEIIDNLIDNLVDNRFVKWMCMGVEISLKHIILSSFKILKAEHTK
jgi:hypothetical protein